MSEALEVLAARKELLLARSRLHRLELRHQARTLRESVLRPRSVLAMATSAPAQTLIIGALLLFVGRRRLSSIARAAAAGLTLIGAVRALLRSGSPPAAP